MAKYTTHSTVSWQSVQVPFATTNKHTKVVCLSSQKLQTPWEVCFISIVSCPVFFDLLLILLNIDLSLAVQHPDKALCAQLVDQLCNGHAGAAHDRADLVLGIVELEVVPLAVDHAAGVCRGAVQAAEPVLAGRKRKVCDLLPEDAHFLRIALQDRLAEQAALRQQTIIILHGDQVQHRRLFRF